ncbi:MAG: hypothetical protein V1778_00830 [bacterium]
MKWFRFSLVVLFALSSFVLSSCSEKGNVEKPAVVDETRQTDVSVAYTGSETLEDVQQSLQELRMNAETPFTDEQEHQIIASFREFQKEQQKAFRPAAWYSAYASHYVWSGHDKDLWLEYKWWAGSQQSYHFETPIWSLYWIIQIRYGGRLTSWSWMEGGNQRVTGIVGSAVYLPFGDAFVRYYLRVVSP